VKKLIPHFIQAQFLTGREQGSFEAFTMFVDMSGFTSLTERLLKNGNEGAERLSIILNNIFEPMVRLVYRKGGFIPHFAGDAFTAIFLSRHSTISAAEVLHTAQEQLVLMKEVNSRFTEFSIRVKIGLSHGGVEWGIMGEAHKAFYFRGLAIDSCAENQKWAGQQQIVMDAPFKNLLPAGYACRQLPDSNCFVLAETTFAVPPNSENSRIELPPLAKKVVAKFLPKSVIEFNQQGEFRTVVAVFISFRGVPNHASLSDFAGIVLEQIYNFSGYLKEVDFGDKGGVLPCIFGAPVSFENNVERALEFVQAIQKELKPMQESGALEFKAGITTGKAYTGIVGGKERCQYAAVGNRVNIAARLMTKAAWGEVLTDGEIQKNRFFKFKHEGDINYRGLAEAIPTYQLLGKNSEMHHHFYGRMIGRDKELEELCRFVQNALSNQVPALAYIFGEAGIGKTRLAFELNQKLKQEDSLYWFICPADQILPKPFNPFIYFLKTYFEQSPENAVLENSDNFESHFQWLLSDCAKSNSRQAAKIRRELQRTKSVLAALIGLKTANSLWENLDAQGRHQNTLAALTNLFKAESLLHPLVIELEDGHWFDDNSKEFLNLFVRHIEGNPIFLLVTSRFYDDGSKPQLIESKVLKKSKLPVLEIDLNILTSNGLERFARERLDGQINREFQELLLRTTNGNPFYAEQVLEYFAESELLEKTNGKWGIKDKDVKVSPSIHSVLAARIDRLSTLVKETVKAAAVIGREFEVPLLTEVMKVQEAFLIENGNTQSILKEQIKTAERGQIWENTNELRYMFKHSLLREAVYDMQLKARLRVLHCLIAEAIERIYSDDLELRYADLVFHFEQAGEVDKTKKYLFQAANFARNHYQNQQALDYYDKLLSLQKKEGKVEQQVESLLNKGGILELIGRWEEGEAALSQALELARKNDDFLRIGKAKNHLGHLLMLRGNYEDAGKYLNTAAAFFESVNFKRGIVKVYGNLGNLYLRQGNYEKAEAHFISSLELAQRFENTSSNAQIVAYLGLTYMNLGKYDDGIRWQQSQLQICRQEDDKAGMAILYTNMGIVYFEKGDYEAALQCYHKGLTLSEELGNKQLTAIAIGSIGSVYQRKGDYQKAMKHFEKDLVITEELGDKQGISIALGLIGELHSVQGAFDKAIHFLEQNRSISEELGYQKGIAKAVNTLGDIYFYKNEFETSLEYYEQAIAVTRGIGNKLVLGFSLVEKGNVLVAMGRTAQAKIIIVEALQIAEQLGNPDLIFEAKILSAKVAKLEGRTAQSKAALEALLQENLDKKEKADVHFELSKFAEDEKHRKLALQLYEELFKETPHYVFQLRIEELL